MQRMRFRCSADFYKRLGGLGIGQVPHVRSDPLFVKKRPPRIVPKQVEVVVGLQYDARRIDKIIKQAIGKAPEIGCITYTSLGLINAPYLETAGRFPGIMINGKRKKHYIFY